MEISTFDFFAIADRSMTDARLERRDVYVQSNNQNISELADRLASFLVGLLSFYQKCDARVW